MKMFLLAFALLFSGNAVSSDKHINHKAPIAHHKSVSKQPKPLKPFKQVGIASWYGYQHAGRKTKSGEIFRPLSATAAHNTLKMGTKVKVTNLKNKKQIIVKINDTGGFAKYGRIIDLSLGAARSIGITGIGRVMVEAI